MSGLKVVFFFPLLPEEDIIKVVVDFFLFKRWGEAGKKGFQPIRKKLGEKFGVVFSFAVVVTDTELSSTDSRRLRMTFSPVTGGRSLILPGILLFLFNTMVVRFEYCGVGVSLLFAIVTSTISGIQPILRQTLVGDVFVFSLIL